MAIVNTGFQRASTITVNKFDAGVLMSSTVFDMKLSFNYNGKTYPSITIYELSRLSDDDYRDRSFAYAAYITSIKQNEYPGLNISAELARSENINLCPIY